MFTFYQIDKVPMMQNASKLLPTRVSKTNFNLENTSTQRSLREINNGKL